MIPPRRPADLPMMRAPIPPRRPEEIRGVYAGGKYFPAATADVYDAERAAARDAQVVAEEMDRIRAIPVERPRDVPVSRGAMLATRDNLYPERAFEEYDAQRQATGSMLADLHSGGVPRGDREGLGDFPVMPLPPRRPADMVPPPPPLPPSRDRLYATNDVYGERGAPIGPAMRERDMYGDGAPVGGGSLPPELLAAMRSIQEQIDALSLAIGIDRAQRPAPPPPPVVIEANIPPAPAMDDFERELARMRAMIRTPLTPEEARRRTAEDMALRGGM